MNNLQIASTRFLKEHTSTILTCLGVAGVVGTAVTAVKATPKAELLLKKAKEEKGEDLTKFEKFKVAGPAYIPSVLIGASTIACIFGANFFNKKTQASITSAYALLDRSYKEYKTKIDELYGEEANNDIEYAIAEDHIDEAPEYKDDGKLLFFDMYSLTYFRAPMEKVLQAEMELNRLLTETGYASILDFYEMLDLEHDEDYSALGWAAGHMYDVHWLSWVDFEHKKTVTDDGLECYILSAKQDPSIEYLNW